MAGAVGFAQSSGEATYKAKCQSCHGAEGTPNPGIAKAMGVKPASDPSVKGHQRGADDRDYEQGKAKMPAFKGKLTDAQIKDSVDYFRPLASKSKRFLQARASVSARTSRRGRRSQKPPIAPVCVRWFLLPFPMRNRTADSAGRGMDQQHNHAAGARLCARARRKPKEFLHD